MAQSVRDFFESLQSQVDPSRTAGVYSSGSGFVVPAGGSVSAVVEDRGTGSRLIHEKSEKAGRSG